MYAEKIICILRKENRNLLRQNDKVSPKEGFLFLFCHRKVKVKLSEPDLRGKEEDEVWPSYSTFPQLAVSPVSPATVQLMCASLHRIHLHSLALTFAIVAY